MPWTPRDADRDAESWSDARPMDGRISGRALDAELERRRRLRRRVVPLLLGAVFLAGTAAALFGEYGYLDLRRSRRELAEAGVSSFGISSLASRRQP